MVARLHRDWLLLATSVLFAHLFSVSSANNSAAYATGSARSQIHHHHRATSPSAATPGSNIGSLLGPELKIIGRVFEDCQSKNDFVGCLKQKALLAISRALQQDTIKIISGFVLEKQNQTEQTGIVDVMTDERALNSLDPLDRDLLLQADKLVRTHALKIDLSVGRAGGKKKKKDKGGDHVKYIVAALLTAMGIAGPIGLKALAAIAVKALVVSKVALTIAGIIALKKLFSHDHHEETSFQVHAGDHNRRSTYVVRPVTKGSAALTSTGSNAGASVDPYRYYYEYH